MTDTATAPAPVWTAGPAHSTRAETIASAYEASTGIWRVSVTKRVHNAQEQPAPARVTYHHDRAPGGEFASYEAALAWLAEHPAQ